jgi:hypothetical protein
MRLAPPTGKSCAGGIAYGGAQPDSRARLCGETDAAAPSLKKCRGREKAAAGVELPNRTLGIIPGSDRQPRTTLRSSSMKVTA